MLRPRAQSPRRTRRRASAASVPGTDRHAGPRRGGARRGLAAHQRHRLGRRADEGEPRVADGGRELLVLREKPVARVDGVGARARARRRGCDRCAGSSRAAGSGRSGTLRRRSARAAPRGRTRSRRRPSRCPSRGTRAQCAQRSRRDWQSGLFFTSAVIVVRLKPGHYMPYGRKRADLKVRTTEADRSALQRDVAVFFRRVPVSLALEIAERRDQLPARLRAAG